MITFFDLIQTQEFRNYVENRIASSTEESYFFPNQFPRLYKYRALSSYAIDDIVNGSLTLSSIGEFNDIFDGAIHQYGTEEEIKKASEEDWKEYESLLKNTPDLKLLLNRKYIIDNSQKHYKTESRLKFRELDYLGTYVCCFSKNNNSTLMWSHYADSNKGICIEYDFNNLLSDSLIRNSIFPVLYTKKPIDVSDLVDDGGSKAYEYPVDAAVLCTALNKSDVWSYEQEWRLVWVLTFAEKETKRFPIKPHILPSKVLLGYHFLKSFFYYDFKNCKEIERIKTTIQVFMQLINYLKSNQIPVSIMLPSIGSYKYMERDISVEVLDSFMKQHFVNHQPTSIRFYYTLHDRLLDLVEKE